MGKLIRILIGIMMFFPSLANAATCNTELSSFFQGKNGCFLLYNLTDDRYEMVYGGEICDKPFSPASTFKIPNSLIGLDSGILKDENTTYRWDGKPKAMKIWEQDHTLASAMQNSVVWYFQRLATKVGERKYHDYLKRFDYGNRDISAGLTTFWLGTSLKITAKEQVAFLKKLYRGELPVSAHAMETVKKILVLESSDQGTLSGKTGSASVEGENIGWFVGRLLSVGKEYLFVTNITQKGTDYKIDGNYAGLTAKNMTKEIFLCQQRL